MIVPSIDLMGGRAVQLVGGERMALDAGDPRPIAERFGRAGEVAVVDLDAALGRGSNAEVVAELLELAPCRVGGGIRDVGAARRWLDAGATRVVLGTAATPAVLRQLPRERVVVALDEKRGEVVVRGWREGTGRSVLERMAELRELAGGFLVTLVDREGRLGGTDVEAARALREAAGDAALTLAGGVTTAGEIAALDGLGVDAQVGMALYTGRLSLAEAVAAPLSSDRPDGLWPTVVCDERGVALGLAYSDAESLGVALDRGVGAYHSRRRGLWVKGETSGAVQRLVRVDADCDRDALRFVVRQTGAFCHAGPRTCFGEERGLGRLERTLRARRSAAPPGSYTARLFAEPELLASKLAEEAGELAQACDRGEAVAETADLVYFAPRPARRPRRDARGRRGGARPARAPRLAPPRGREAERGGAVTRLARVDARSFLSTERKRPALPAVEDARAIVDDVCARGAVAVREHAERPRRPRGGASRSRSDATRSTPRSPRSRRPSARSSSAPPSGSAASPTRSARASRRSRSRWTEGAPGTRSPRSSAPGATRPVGASRCPRRC